MIVSSTISNNAANNVAGVRLLGSAATQLLKIVNSTIAFNHSSPIGFGSGLFLGFAAEITSSTISGNTERPIFDQIPPAGAGLYMQNGIVLDLQSTIISGNVRIFETTETPSDMGNGSATPTSVVNGSNNLIGDVFNTPPLPPDTISSTDPGLGPLADNGGPTFTLVPLPTSLAINAGNNATSLAFDQRGTGYPRVLGANAEIGAVEAPEPDVIFANGFD